MVHPRSDGGVRLGKRKSSMADAWWEKRCDGEETMSHFDATFNSIPCPIAASRLEISIELLIGNSSLVLDLNPFS